MEWLHRQFSVGVALLAAALLLWVFAASGWALVQAQWDMSRVSYRSTGAGIEFDKIKELRNQIALTGRGAVTGWAQTLQESIEREATGDSTLVDVIWADGDAARIWNPHMLRGQMPQASDRYGCALDDKTALRLFGSLDILGMKLQIAGQEMAVCGVFAFPENLGAILAAPGRGLAFCPAARADDGIKAAALEFSLWPNSGKTPKEQAQTLMAAAKIGTDGQFDDHRDALDALALLVALPGCALAVFSLFSLGARLLRLTKGALERARRITSERVTVPHALPRVFAGWGVRALALALLLGLVLWQTPVQGRIPPSFLPTRWSDFSFWPGLMQSLLQRGVQARLGGALRPDLLFGALQAVCAGLCALSALLILWARRALRRGLPTAGAAQCALGALPVMLAVPLGLWIAARLFLPPGTLRGMLVLPLGFYGAFALHALDWDL